MPATGVEKIREWPEGIVVYRTACECGGSNCDLSMWLELDPDDQVVLHMNQNLVYADWSYTHWYERLWERVKAAARILFTGWVEVEGDFIFRSPDHIGDVIEALQDCLGRLIIIKANKEE